MTLAKRSRGRPRHAAQGDHLESAQLISGLRTELGMSQIEFAKLIGMSQPIVSKIEKAQLPPSLRAFLQAYRLARMNGGEHEKHVLAFERYMISGKL